MMQIRFKGSTYVLDEKSSLVVAQSFLTIDGSQQLQFSSSLAAQMAQRLIYSFVASGQKFLWLYDENKKPWEHGLFVVGLGDLSLM